MSLYKKAWLFTLFNVLLLVAFYFGVPILDRVLGSLWLLVFGFYILGQGMVAMTVFNCPKCGLSPFMGSQSLFTSYSPFPRKKCGHCGHDHTMTFATPALVYEQPITTLHR